MTDLSKPLDGLGLAQVNGIINDRLAKKQNVLTPGDGISIVEQDGKTVISSAGDSGNTAYLINAPLGTIVIWSGTAENVPEGWSVCNGENGTLDLRDKFVLAAGDGHEVGEADGAEEVTLTTRQMPKHNHSLKIGSAAIYVDLSSGSDLVSTGFMDWRTGDTGESEPHPNMPPYYTALYIQKTGVTPSDYTTREDVEEIVQETGGEVYSTEETVIGRWIDGRPIYRKVYSLTTYKGSGIHGLGIYVLDVDSVVTLRGILEMVSTSTSGVPGLVGDFLVPVPYAQTSNATILYNTQTGELVMYTNIDKAYSKPMTLIFEYTKTTDQGS